MRYFGKIALIIAATLAIACNGPKSVQHLEYAEDPVALGYQASSFDDFDKFLESSIESSTVSNAVALIAQHGKIIYHKAFGVRDITSQTPTEKDDIYPLISLTKPIVSAAFLQLCEKGLVSLDTPVTDIFPEFPTEVLETVNPDGTYTTRPAKTIATFKHLLTHTSGFGAESIVRLRLQKNNLSGMEVLEPLQNGQHTGGYFPSTKYLSVNMDDLLTYPLAFDPGTRWAYHEGLNLVGYAIERITKQTLRDYVKENILNPLDMKDTDWYYDEEVYDRIAKVCIPAGGTLIPGGESFAFNICGPVRTYCEGATGLNSTVEDYAKFAQMLLNGGKFNNHRILEAESVGLMTGRNLLPDGIIDEKTGLPARFSIGFRVYDKSNKILDIISDRAFEWPGMTGAKLFVEPEQDAIFIIFNSVLDMDNTKFKKEYLPYVYDIVCTK